MDKSMSQRFTGTRCKEMGGLRKVAEAVHAFLPPPLDGFFFLSSADGTTDYFYASSTKEASKQKRKKFYRILSMAPALQSYWDYLLTESEAPPDDLTRTKITKIRLELPKLGDLDIVTLDISADGKTPFYRKGNEEWDEGYVKMRDHNPYSAVRETYIPDFWLRRRWLSRPTDVITFDRAAVTEKNLPILWRKFPLLPTLLTECLYNKVLELERTPNENIFYNFIQGVHSAANSNSLSVPGSAAIATTTTTSTSSPLREPSATPSPTPSPTSQPPAPTTPQVPQPQRTLPAAASAQPQLAAYPGWPGFWPPVAMPMYYPQGMMYYPPIPTPLPTSSPKKEKASSPQAIANMLAVAPPATPNSAPATPTTPTSGDVQTNNGFPNKRIKLDSSVAEAKGPTKAELAAQVEQLKAELARREDDIVQLKTLVMQLMTKSSTAASDGCATSPATQSPNGSST